MKVQKRLASQILKCSPYRIVFDTEYLDEIKEAITNADIRSLISQGIISRKPVNATSRFHARKIKAQKRKGRRKGFGSRKGVKTARTPSKEQWIRKIRLQRELLRILREKEVIDSSLDRSLYMKSRVGFFRSRRHMNLYIKEVALAKTSEK